jgi:hypothetical protein
LNDLDDFASKIRQEKRLEQKVAFSVLLVTKKEKMRISDLMLGVDFFKREH